MTEFYVQMQDANGTAYGTCYPFTDDTIYFDDIAEAKMYAKGRLSDEYILAQVIDAYTGRVVDFFVKGE